MPRYHSTCGLRPDQLDELTTRLQQAHHEAPFTHKYNFTMAFAQAVIMVLIMIRHNLTQQLVADLYGIAQPTVCRIWRYLYPMIGQVTAMNRQELAQALERGIVIVDGTPIPTGNRVKTGKDNWNHKHHKQALGIQVATYLDGKLAAVSKPVKGSRHDSKALEDVGWAQQIAAAQAADPLFAALADSAYIVHTDLAVRRKKPRQPRSEQDKVFNQVISHYRAAVERGIAHLKQWKILATGYRGPLDELPTMIQVVTNLEFFRQNT